ncbi:MAG: archaeal heat shock protein Hsp20 [Nitrososphaeraceae archaeon]
MTKTFYNVICITNSKMKDMWRDPWNFKKIFEEMDKEFSYAEDMLNRFFRTAKEDMNDYNNMPYYYGYQITTGPDGKPHVREFGNVRPSGRGLVEQSTTREPLIDARYHEKDNQYVITAEMPGVSKDNINISISEQVVTINAANGDKKYSSEIPLDKEIDENNTKAAYSNGILELKIGCKTKPKSESKKIKIE